MSSVPGLPVYVRTPSAAFLSSLSVDRGFLRYDLAGSIAHVEMLAATGVLGSDEAACLIGGLRTIAREDRAGVFPWRDELEDVHTNVEVRLTELLGTVGGKLHTGRSRNDQIALDERLFLRQAVHSIADALLEVESDLLALAEREAGTPMPGYTHLQRAQPVTVGHLLLGHFWAYDRDLDRLFATEARANVSPLGAGALAGSTLPIDPEIVARRLGFDRAFENSLDAVSDRDPIAEILFDLTLLLVHASGFAEEIVLFATKEFGFLLPTPELGSGSSLMPQKRNPDAAELIRGKTGRALGDLVALLTTLKGLPYAYNRDLQEDKAPVLDAVATGRSVLQTLHLIVPNLRFDAARLSAAAADSDLYATDRAEELVRNGTPFREAHATVAAGWGAHGAPDVSVSPSAALARRATPGGPSPEAVTRQIAQARTRWASRRTSLSSLGRKVALAEELIEEPRK
ncbi:MAG: argininosuccinate lyase [Thermoplasmata archaeon]